jgi:signal transduction histidine kinase/ActR/RegA family two-component response regulator
MPNVPDALPAARTDLDRRVLILAPTRRDSDITESLLTSAGLPHVVCADMDELVAAAGQGAAAVLLAEETIPHRWRARLADELSRQPPWSDLPILLFTHPGADSAAAAEAVSTLGNVTLLERPIRVSTLMSAVRTALRARDRQYQIRGHLEERERAEASLRAADQRKDQFLATLGHELRNPLAPLLTALEVLKLETIAGERARLACATMERQLRHLIRLVDDLLEVSRFTRGLIDVQKVPLDLRGVLETAVETSRPLIEAARHTLSLELPAEPIPIAGDSVRLTQVVANLLNNAAKYTEPGGRIWLTGRTEGDRAIVSVRDSGIGIPTSQLSVVFDLFAQVERSRHGAHAGLGIGLTLVRSLVAMHGGVVEARSGGPGRGSEFIVRLPLLPHLAARPVEAPRAGRFPPVRLLIVDDNQDAAKTLGTLLSALGATTSVAFNGADALAAIDTFRPDAVLLDLGMPGMDGYEVARRIRSRSDLAGVRLIALTGWGQEDDRERSRQAGFDHHVVKPIDIESLRRLFRNDTPTVHRKTETVVGGS